MRLAVKVDVDTYVGTRDGVPTLAEIFKKHSLPATFLFSFGPDNTGKALRRIFRKGFLRKCLRSNVAGNYGLKTLLYGTLLPAPKIAKLCAKQMKDVAKEGFACGIHSWDHFKWQDYLPTMRPTEIESEFGRARADFEKVIGRVADCCGAPGWQITPDALQVEDDANLLYASDVRGVSPFFPKMGGRTFKTLQIPSTLPTLDEMLGIVKPQDAANEYLKQIQSQENSVMTVHAELEGNAYAEWFDELLTLLESRGVKYFALEDWAKDLLSDRENIPTCEIKMDEFEGRSGLLAQQVL